MAPIVQNDILSNVVWMPEDVQRVLGCDRFPVTLYDEAFETEVIDACRDCQHIGLSHIRLGNGKNILVCLTTTDQIIVIDMKQQSHKELLDILVRQKEIIFYTIRGYHLAYVLKVEFKLDISDAYDLTTFDIFLSMRKATINGALLGSYTIRRLAEARDDVKYRDRADLAKFWLNVDSGPKDQIRESAETQVIRDHPESIAAANVIRKRSCLIRALAIKMREKFEDMMYQDVNNLYEFAHKVNGEEYVEYENKKDDSYTTLIDYLKKQ